MNRRDNFDKQMKKLEKTEEKQMKILNKQHRDLLKLISENEKMIENRMNKGTPQETKLELEIEKLSKKLQSMRTEMHQIRAKREEALTPLRERGIELREKLKLVETQLDSTNFYRERRSQSRLDLNSPGSGQTPFLMQQSSSEHSRINEEIEERNLENDFSPSSPPPYSPYSE